MFKPARSKFASLRLLRHVLAAGVARLGRHVLHPAADAHPTLTPCARAYPDASGLFNRMRNLGGAIGFGLKREEELLPPTRPLSLDNPTGCAARFKLSCR